MKHEKEDIEVLKGQLKFIDSYSAFGGQGEETQLAWFLREKNVKKVYCVGLAFDYCVGSTAESAAQEGFETYLIKDACKSVNPAEESIMGNRLYTIGAKLITVQDFLSNHSQKTE